MKEFLKLEPTEIDLLAAACKVLSRCGDKKQREAMGFLYLDLVKQHPKSDGATKLSFDLEQEIDGLLLEVVRRARRGVDFTNLEESQVELSKLKDWALDNMRGER